MDSSDQIRQTLVYADGYSYTEIFQAPPLSGMQGGKQLVSVFHAMFTSERDSEAVRDIFDVTQHRIKPQRSGRTV